MSEFESLVRKSLKNIREVKNIETVGFVAHVTIDLTGIQVPWVLDQLNLCYSLWKKSYPNASLSIEALDGNFIGRFPLDTVEAVGGSGVVPTVYD